MCFACRHFTGRAFMPHNHPESSDFTGGETEAGRFGVAMVRTWNQSQVDQKARPAFPSITCPLVSAAGGPSGLAWMKVGSQEAVAKQPFLCQSPSSSDSHSGAHSLCRGRPDQLREERSCLEGTQLHTEKLLTPPRALTLPSLPPAPGAA